MVNLELLPSEWSVLEDILKLLRPFRIATAHLSGAKYPTMYFFVGTLLHVLQCEIIIQDDGVSAIKAFKRHHKKK